MNTIRPTRMIAIVGLAAATLLGGASAVEAASSGSVTGTVQINIAPAPVACITLDKTAVTFSNAVTELLPTNATASIHQGSVTVTNCGGAVDLSVTTSNATGGGVTWAPANGNVCSNGPDKYDLFVDSTTHALTAPTTLTNGLAASPASRLIAMNFKQACVGSAIPAPSTNMSFTVTFTAALA